MQKKFSVIIPVYNTEKYLEKCLDSLINQTFGDFEIIVVNDGSPDNSQSIIDRYVQKYPNKVRAFFKQNSGPSEARNLGVQKAEGEYLTFVDSDDYVSLDLLEILNQEIVENSPDTIRFSAQVVYENGQVGEIISAPEVSNISGEEALNLLIDNKKYFDTAALYAYKKSFWDENGFEYAKGRYNEDFGLTPEIIMRSKSFSCISCIGYFYVQSSDSIMRNTNYEKSVIKVNDVLYHSLKHIRLSNELIGSKKIRAKFCSYIANALICQINNLKDNDRKEYIETLKKEKIFDMLLADSLKRMLKRTYLKLKYGAF